MLNRIYIVEDHAFMRETIRLLLEREPDLTVCGMAVTGEDAFEELAGIEVELILVDTCLPEMNGIDLIKALLEREPGLRCLMHSGHDEPSYVKRALTAGARGYLLKGNAEELPKAIRQVLGGDLYLSEPLRNGEHDGS